MHEGTKTLETREERIARIQDKITRIKERDAQIKALPFMWSLFSTRRDQDDFMRRMGPIK